MIKYKNNKLEIIMCGKKYYRNNKLELTAKINDELKIITIQK